MDMKNSKEITKNILERYNFDVIYSHTEYVYGMISSQNFIDEKNAVDYLYSAAVVGNKAVGIFDELPYFELDLPVRSECIFITSKLMKRISAPTIFIRKPDEISDRLSLALKISVESKLPIVVVMTPNAENNYAEFNKINTDLGRISPYLSSATFHNKLSGNDINSALASADEMLASIMPDKDLSENTLSLYDPNVAFVDYLIPYKLHNSIKKLINNTINVYIDEQEELYNFFYFNYGVELKFNSIANTRGFHTEEILCPGCPFVNIFAKINDKDIVIFSDITCAGVKYVFPQINYISIDGYIGLTNNDLRVKTLFIGKTSTYRLHYRKYINNAKIILLNDTSIRKLDGFTNIRHPKKLNANKNTLYPYGCSYIKSYSRVKVKEKKCKCFQGGNTCSALQETRCPALYKLDNILQIDSNMCKGCLACKLTCKFGAIS